MALNGHALNSRTLAGPPAVAQGTLYPDRELLTVEWLTYGWDADRELLSIDWDTYSDADRELLSIEWNVGIIGDHELLRVDWDTIREQPDRELLSIDWGVFWRVNPDRRLLTVNWDVVQATEYPDRALLEFDWRTYRNLPDRQLLGVNWRVYDADAPVQTTGLTFADHVVVYINGQDVSDRVLLDSMTITHSEDQASSADITLLYDIDAPIAIPSLNGRSLIIEAYNDPSDHAAGTWRMFTGWIERSSYSRAERAVRITGSDLRSERLGEEDQGDLLQLTQAVYSEVTQQEDATGDTFVSEMMKTVSGSIGYDKSGNLHYYSWLINGVTPAVTYTDADISAEQIAIDYQTRSEVVNVVTISMSYRYTGLRTMRTTVHGEQSYREWGGKYAGSFLRSTIVDRIQNNFSPWVATEYQLIDMPTYKQASSVFGRYLVYFPDPNRCMGYTATLERYIAQPVTEEYSIRVIAPQSIRAYGKEIQGSSMNFAVDDNANFDSAQFEERDSVYTPTNKLSSSGMYEWPTGGKLVRRAGAVSASYLASTSDGGTLPVVDGQRELFNAGLRAATLMAQKEIRASHRKNHVDVTRFQLENLELGAVVELDTRVVSTVGQCTGITYTVSDRTGLQTAIKIQISSMDDAGPVPPENWTSPGAQVLATKGSPTVVKSPKTTTRNGSINFDVTDKVLTVTAPEVGSEHTSEVTTRRSVEYVTALENQTITLINGW